MCQFRLDLAYYPTSLLRTYPFFSLNFRHLPHVYIISFLHRSINTRVLLFLPLTHGLTIDMMYPKEYERVNQTELYLSILVGHSCPPFLAVLPHNSMETSNCLEL